MATLNVIRLWALRDQMSIREISRRTGLAQHSEEVLAVVQLEPQYAKRVSSSKLDPYVVKGCVANSRGQKIAETRRASRQLHTTP